MLDMLAEVYAVFGLTYKLALSTRPEGYLGTLEQWDRAEAALTDALNQTGLDWEVSQRLCIPRAGRMRLVLMSQGWRVVFSVPGMLSMLSGSMEMQTSGGAGLHACEN